MHKKIKLKLNDAGELMVQKIDGNIFELHLHNTSFNDEHRLVTIYTGIANYWLSSKEINYSWMRGFTVQHHEGGDRL